MKLLITVAAVGLSSLALAQITLVNGNSTATIDPTSVEPTIRRGMNSWEVDGVDQLFQQWYWFRVGNGPERSIDTISAPIVNQTGLNSVTITYTANTWSMDLFVTLVGGTNGSGTADVSEIVRITNRGTSALDFHLFEYDDFDIGGTFGNDTATRLDASSIRQSDGLTSVTVGAVPAASHWQIAEVPTVFDILDDGLASNLSDSGSPTGPGDVAFGFQWDATVAAGGSWIMSKNKVVSTVPEPATMAVLGLGAAFLARRRKR